MSLVSSQVMCQKSPITATPGLLASRQMASATWAQEMAFAAVERLEQHARAGLVRVVAQLGQQFDQQLARFLVAELGLVIKGRHHDHPDRTQRTRRGEDLFHAVHGGAANLLLFGDRDAFEAGADCRRRLRCLPTIPTIAEKAEAAYGCNSAFSIIFMPLRSTTLPLSVTV